MKKMLSGKIPFGVILASVCAFLSGCCFFHPCDGRDTMADFPEQGFQMFATPRSSYLPGTIVRQNKKGTMFTVDNLNRDNRLNISTIDESIGGVERTGKFGFNLGFIFGPAGKGNFDLNKNSTLAFKAGGVTRSVTSDSDIERLLPETYARIKTLYKPGWRYFLIRETISVKSIAYSFDRETITNIGGEGKINEAISATAGLKWDGRDRFQLSENFEPARQIFFKPEELLPRYYARKTFMAVKALKLNTAAAKSSTTVMKADTAAMESSAPTMRPDTFVRVPVTEKLAWVDEQNP